MRSTAFHPLGSGVTELQHNILGNAVIKSKQRWLLVWSTENCLLSNRLATASLCIWASGHANKVKHIVSMFSQLRDFFPQYYLHGEQKSHSSYECISCLCLVNDKILPLWWPCKDELVTFRAKHEMHFCYTSFHMRIVPHLRLSWNRKESHGTIK